MAQKTERGVGKYDDKEGAVISFFVLLLICVPMCLALFQSQGSPKAEVVGASSDEGDDLIVTPVRVPGSDTSIGGHSIIFE